MSIVKRLSRKEKLWIIAILLIIFIKLFSLNKLRVEDIYTHNIYPFISQFLRILFGWIPFSLGDILYITVALWLLFTLIKNIRLLFKRKLKAEFFLKKFSNAVLILLFIYIVFNILWGLNYNRKGVASQLGLNQTAYDTSDVIMLQTLLLQKVNASKNSLIERDFIYPDNKELFQRAGACYREAELQFPFLKYKVGSIKSSLYGWMGNYLGFTGYYNPFTGEAQVNTTVPKFLQPYIATHEMAHQIGYAKEDEANFAGYLAAVNSTDTLFHYSAYLDLFMYANREVYYFDSVAAKQSFVSLIPEVKADIEEWRKFNLAHKSFIEPAITWMYGKYLKLNEQPKGMRSYNEVIVSLIAYYKKFGKI
jgi:uncharacterized membrane protein YhaH (DUF805 family)